MSALPKIPSPPAHHWREFRFKYMPLLVFSGVLAIAVNLWNNHVAPPSIVGEVETVRSSVTTTIQGEILSMSVDYLQKVEKGDIIATVKLMDDDLINATIKAEEASLATMEERLRQNNFRIVENYENLKQSILTRKVERATENANLQFRKNEFKRASELYKEGATNNTISISEYELAKMYMETAQEKVTELDKLIVEMEVSLTKLAPPTDLLTNTNSNDAIRQGIEAQRILIAAQTKPQVIRAPMAGVISAVLKRTGEKVIRGDSIVVISSLEPERIIGYVRQPLNIRPKLGDTVEVRARSFSRPSAIAKVMKVGTQLEAISPAMLPTAMQSQNMQEYGLPILIALPKGLNLMPGETVDISVTALK
jgi:multidrug resistance efflux pump